MPIDFKKVIHQIKNLEGQDKYNTFTKRLEETFKQFLSAQADFENLHKKLVETNATSKAAFTFATPHEFEDPGKLITPNANFTKPHIVISTDGSQIFSSAHEITSASLINIGLIALPYFSKEIPVQLSSEPTIYNSAEDVNPTVSNDKISDEDLISYERTLKEIEELVNIAEKYSKYKLPMVALLDGTLIFWHLEKFNQAFIEHFISRFSKAFSKLKSYGIPIASYISSSRSNDIISMLKISKCIYDSVDCKKHCANLLTKDLPCNPTPDYKPVLDRRIIEKHFIENKAERGTRTTIFKPNSKILNSYPDDLKTFFFYMNSGTEIARVELPQYVVNDKAMLTLLHNVLSSQCKVGYGYPIALSEAHIQAVVRNSDRQIFYELLREHTLKSTSQRTNLSTKELKKRISFV